MLTFIQAFFMQFVHPTPWLAYSVYKPDPYTLIKKECIDWNKDEVRASTILFSVFITLIGLVALILTESGSFQITGTLSIYWIWVWWGSIFMYSLIQKVHLVTVVKLYDFNKAGLSIHRSTVFWVGVSFVITILFTIGSGTSRYIFLLAYMTAVAVFNFFRAILPLFKSYLTLKI